VQFYSCKVFGLINPIDGKTPQNVSYCGVDDSNTAELRFNIEDRGNEPIKIINIASIEEFKEALNTYLPRIEKIIRFLDHIFKTWCEEIKVSFETNPKVIMEGENTFKEYRLNSKIMPIPVTGNTPSHILIGVDGDDTLTSTMFVRFEKQFHSKRIVLKEFKAKSTKEFKTIIVSNIDLKHQMRPQETNATNLHQALQDYCNDGNIPVLLNIGISYSSKIDSGQFVQFSVYDIVDKVQDINGEQPRNVSFCANGADYKAELRFNVKNEQWLNTPIKIIKVDNIDGFEAALHTHLRIDA
jgi:hypothetical protein